MIDSEDSLEDKISREVIKLRIRTLKETISYPIIFLMTMIMVGVLKNNNIDGLIFKDFNCNRVDTYLRFDQCLESVNFKGQDLQFSNHYKNPYYHFKIGKRDSTYQDYNTNIASVFGKKYKITDYDEAKRCIPDDYIDHRTKTVTTVVIWFSGNEINEQQTLSFLDKPNWCTQKNFEKKFNLTEQRMSFFGIINYLWLGIIIIPLISLTRFNLLYFTIADNDESPDDFKWRKYLIVFPREYTNAKNLKVVWTIKTFICKGLVSYFMYTSLITYRDYCSYEDDYLRCGINTKISKSVLILMNLESFHSCNIFFTITILFSIVHFIYVLPLTVFFLIAFIKVEFLTFIELFNFSFFPIFNIITADLYKDLNTPLGVFYSPNLWILIQELVIVAFVLYDWFLLSCDSENIDNTNRDTNRSNVDQGDEHGTAVSIIENSL